ncbi:YbgC/FadM family acyl-CoA thioesterase [Piscinibacter sakaiensis]|uniref:YbgC/FadM family acyl-CoA thioesterase n=1 Tax=Piscinibacter sakaiensis TaxID=1547922 RepID=UPI00372A5DA1
MPDTPPPPTRADFRFFERLRVRWSEIDAQQIVFNGHYLAYLDTAVAGYWRAMAMPYHETMAGLQGDLYVKKATLEYHRSARYEDLLDIGMRCVQIGRSSMRFAAGVFRQDVLLVGGELVYVFADPATQTSRPVPARLREALQAFEAGEAMARVELGRWDTLAAPAGAIRTQVFVEEQGIPAEMEWDAADAGALHAVALDALAQAAQARSDAELLLHAQTSAQAFYARAGFQPRGPVFEEAGIPHVEMVRALG